MGLTLRALKEEPNIKGGSIGITRRRKKKEGGSEWLTKERGENKKTGSASSEQKKCVGNL